ncbi:hypothetical protein JOF39_003684 [Glutamicibacter protophormiae]|uniref:Uncharacterized protein n=1 Tax=Glutamicibacter protophormiae TaxID=37930 RepID=A0ABS4XVI4_GLUPR|nr:hypothetical protein [Glutamicibacter protophormiae]GGM01350.1 hypothetical protein GCM10010038_34260 [Glutamicibacter protophormiae]
MNTPNLHTDTTQRVQELLQCPEARRHLTSYGWLEGMPVVFARPAERVDDVMGLVSVHGRAVLLALTDEAADDIQLWHITVPSPIFARVAPLPSEATVRELCVRHAGNRLTPFRVAFWAHSAAINEIPLHPRTDRNPTQNPSTSYNG